MGNRGQQRKAQLNSGLIAFDVGGENENAVLNSWCNRTEAAKIRNAAAIAVNAAQAACHARSADGWRSTEGAMKITATAMIKITAKNLYRLSNISGTSLLHGKPVQSSSTDSQRVWLSSP
jgi:hypothetical protein